MTALMTAERPFLRYFDACDGDKWKNLVLAAEAHVMEPEYALEQEPERYLLKALIPGAALMSVEVRESVLRLKGKSIQRFTNGDTFGYVRETEVDETFRLPPDAAEAGVTTVLNGSILYVSIPKVPCLPAEASDVAEGRA